jgi:DNA polymerase V
MLTTQLHCLPLVLAGFPSPALDYKEKRIDFNELMNLTMDSVFPLKVVGHSMMDAHIPHGSIVVVDKSIEPRNNTIVIATLNGENVIKHLVRTNDGIFLLPANENFKSVRVTEDMDFSIWGTVTHVVIDILRGGL